MFISPYYWSFKIKPKNTFIPVFCPLFPGGFSRAYHPPLFVSIGWCGYTSHFFYFYFFILLRSYIFAYLLSFLIPFLFFRIFQVGDFIFLGCYKVAFNSHNWFCLFSAIFCCVYWLNLLFLCLAIKLRFYNLYFPRSVKIGVSFFLI